MTLLRQRLLEDMQLRGLAERTQEAYLSAVQQLALHYGKPPDLITEEVLQRLKVDQDANKEYFMGQIDKIRNGVPKEEYFAQIDRRKKHGITDAQQRIPEDPPEDIIL